MCARCRKPTSRWFDANLADDFLNSNPDGTLVDRAAFLAQIAKKTPLTNLREDDVRIVIRGDFAFIHARTSLHQARRHARRRPLHRHLVEARRSLALRHRACDAGVKLIIRHTADTADGMGALDNAELINVIAFQ